MERRREIQIKQRARRELITLVEQNQISIYAASKMLDFKYSTAKLILKRNRQSKATKRQRKVIPTAELKINANQEEIRLKSLEKRDQHLKKQEEKDLGPQTKELLPVNEIKLLPDSSSYFWAYPTIYFLNWA